MAFDPLRVSSMKVHTVAYRVIVSVGFVAKYYWVRFLIKYLSFPLLI